MAAALPPQARVRLALAVAELALPLLRGRPGEPAAAEAVAVARRWAAGDAAPEALDAALQDEQDRGLLVAAQSAPAADLPVWQALAAALTYVSWQDYRLAGEAPGPLVVEVGEDAFAEMDGYLHEVAAFDWPALRRRWAELAPR